MDTGPLLPDATALRLDQVSVDRKQALIVISSARPTGICPVCGHPAARVHSRYDRTLQDLSWQGTHVTVRWRSRKFFCDAPGCSRRIFTEQIPTVSWRYGRCTVRARDVLQCLAVAMGGEAGCRVARQLSLAVSGDTLLRQLRRIECAAEVPPRVIGVDDWALRRGQNYGTVIVDLERHRPTTLLPDRKWETFRDWLLQHPTVEIVSRDRADCYARGASAGAPTATQVADRWHLLANLREALQRAAERYSAEIRQCARRVAAAAPSVEAKPAAVPSPPPDEPKRTARTMMQETRRSRRVERYQRVKQLHEQGLSQREIARRLDLHRETVRRFLGTSTFPERASRRARNCTTPFHDELKRRWEAGCHNARTLTQELMAIGFRGSYDSVRRQVAAWRSAQGQSPAPSSRSITVDVPSPHRVAWQLFLLPEELDAHDQRLSQAIQRQCPELQVAAELAHDFTNIFKQKQVDRLADWIDRAAAENAPIELRRFAQGLVKDRAAIEAALALPWSNGQTEGQINRLKLIKREMYGRAGLDLLSRRFLIRPAAN